MKTKTIWIIDEGSQGHVVQSRGLIRELSKRVDLNTTEIKGALKVRNGLLKSMAKRLLRKWPKPWIYAPFHHLSELPAETPDLIVASGPRALTTLAYLGKKHGCPSVFVQASLEVPLGTVDYIIKPDEGHQRPDYIFIPLLFTDITSDALDAAAKTFLQEQPLPLTTETNVLFIGASSSKIPFIDDDWTAIARFVNALYQQDGSRWLVTTSYRTGRRVEALMKRLIDPAALLDAVWYSEAPRRVTKPFLGLATRVFVTVDSLTMLTEAIASGRPVYALSPARLGEESSNPHLGYVHRLAQGGLVAMIQPQDPPHLPLPSAPVTIDYSGAIQQLLQQLHWNP